MLQVFTGMYEIKKVQTTNQLYYSIQFYEECMTHAMSNYGALFSSAVAFALRGSDCKDTTIRRPDIFISKASVNQGRSFWAKILSPQIFLALHFAQPHVA